MTISTILFVCTGNTCRSPLAEGLANKWLDEHDCKGWLAVSAGVLAIDGTPTSEETIHALSERGIVYKGTSKPLTQAMAKEANVVFCMSKRHLTVAKQFAKNAQLLGDDGDISDPIGQGQSAYDALADSLEKLIACKLEKLTELGA
jgi:protein-tyrosine-phosphatase